MESMIDLQDLEMRLRDVLVELQRAKNLVDDGKEVLCSRRLQGAITKCHNIYRLVKEDEIMVEPSGQEQIGT